MSILKGIKFDNEEALKRISDRVGHIHNPVCDRSISRHNASGILLGGVIFTDWTGEGGSVSIHSSGWHPRWINRDLLWMVFSYAFDQLQVKKILGPTPANNHHALQFNRKLGFKQEAVIRDVFPDGDMVLLAMYRADCRFLDLYPRSLEPVDGQKDQGPAGT